jgi:hypothetical protein
MIRRFLVLILVFCICCCSGQQPVVTKLDKKTVKGKLIGFKNWSEFTIVKIKRNKHYIRREFINNGVLELSKGKWKIINDTLVLIEKFYKKKNYKDNRMFFFTFRKKIRNNKGQARLNKAKLILYKGQWMEIEDNKFIAKLVYKQYGHKGIGWRSKNSPKKD